MTIKAILVAVSGGSATGGAIDLACQLAQRFRAHLEGYHVQLDIAGAAAVLGDEVALGPTGMIIEAMLAEGRVTASQVRSLFDTILARHGIAVDQWPQPVEGRASACWREQTGYAPELVAKRARFFDLAVLGRSGRAVDGPYSDTVEEVLGRSGRPVLLAPAEAPSAVSSTIAIAWNGSAESVKALAMSLPFLALAETVWLVTARIEDCDSVESTIEYLGWHGISRVRHYDVPDRPVRHGGRLLLDAAQSCGADLLVMGGYGHSPWREAVLGGATREAVLTMTMPLLLMH